MIIDDKSSLVNTLLKKKKGKYTAVTEAHKVALELQMR